MDVQHFPFDTQHCHLKFGSWTYDQARLNLLSESKEVDISKMFRFFNCYLYLMDQSTQTTTTTVGIAYHLRLPFSIKAVLNLTKLYVCIYKYIYIYIYMLCYVCMYIYISTIYIIYNVYMMYNIYK